MVHGGPEHREWLGALRVPAARRRGRSSALDVATLAGRASMSVRTFTRRFREETGQSPGAWVTQQRVRHAQHLLEATDLPVDDVATRAGLGTAASLRQHLHASVGVSPSAYRRTFRGAVDA